MDFSAYLEKFAGQIEKSLEKILPRKYSEATLASLLETDTGGLDVKAINKSVNVPIWDLLDRGGKRWRPILFLTILELFGKDPHDFVDLATIFEVIHNGTLIVDDIEDGSKSRRGKKSIHLIYSEDVTINAGNLIYFLPLKVLEDYGALLPTFTPGVQTQFHTRSAHSKLSQEQLLKIYQTFVSCMIKLHFGQATDIAWHKGLIEAGGISEDQYLQMCAFKTGGLARMASKVAAVVGGADDKLTEVIGQLGESLGVVFQIQDDILNITENRLSKMKGLGDDITEGKISLPVILALKGLPKEKRGRLLEILRFHTNDQKLILEAIGLIKVSGAVLKSQQLMNHLFDETWAKLDKKLPDNDKKISFYKLALFLINRKV